MRICALVLAFCNVLSANPATKLILFGGGAIPEAGIQKLIQLAGGKTARILFIPWASSTPYNDYDDFVNVTEPHLPANIVRAEPYEKVKKNTKDFIASISDFSGIFFSGGDQNIVIDNLNDSPEIQKALITHFSQGAVFSGTSAGLAIMSSTMLTGNADMTELDPKAVETRAGLGLLIGAVLDQHFIRRNRIQRLLSVMLGSTERYGIGVDENTGIYVENGKDVEVIGKRKVVVIDNGEMPGKIALEIHESGSKFTLAEYRKSEPKNFSQANY